MTAQWTSGEYFGATVTSFEGGMYHLKWDDGSRPLWVRPEQIRKE